LRAHATIVLLPQFTATSYIDAVQHYRCTLVDGGAADDRHDAARQEHMARADFSSVEFVRMGSAPVSESLMGPSNAPAHAAITNAYGTTEGGPVCFPVRIPRVAQPELSVVILIRKFNALVDGDTRDADHGALEMKSPAVMNGFTTGPISVPFTPDGFYMTGTCSVAIPTAFISCFRAYDDMFGIGRRDIIPRCRAHAERHRIFCRPRVPIEDEIRAESRRLRGAETRPAIDPPMR